MRRLRPNLRPARPRASGWTLAALALLALGVMVYAGCAPGVGSSCALSTDCGATGNLVCDTSQFGGYCTFVNCVPNQCPGTSPGQCPKTAACVLFNPMVPGCGVNDRQGGSRAGQQFCMQTCSSNSDCRDGYVCADPRQAPWFADILDDCQTELVCIGLPPSGTVGGVSMPPGNPDAAVCQVTGPMFDAGFPPLPEAAADALMSVDAKSSSDAPRESSGDAPGGG